MDQHRVVLICQMPLLCEGIQRVIESLGDVQLVTLECADAGAIESCLQKFAPATVLIAGEGPDVGAARLVSTILNNWPDISVISVDLATNVLRVYTAQTLPANSQQLLGAIRQANLHPNRSQVRARPVRRR